MLNLSRINNLYERGIEKVLIKINDKLNESEGIKPKSIKKSSETKLIDFVINKEDIQIEYSQFEELSNIQKELRKIDREHIIYEFKSKYIEELKIAIFVLHKEMVKIKKSRDNSDGLAEIKKIFYTANGRDELPLLVELSEVPELEDPESDISKAMELYLSLHEVMCED